MTLPWMIRNLVFLVAFFFVVGRTHTGFVAAMLLPFFVVHWLYDIIVLIRKPEQRAVRATRMGVWILAFAVVAAMNWYWYRTSRNDAERVIAAVTAFKSRTGSYPRDLQEAGVDATATERWMLSYRLDASRRPGLSYGVPFMIFDQYDYDFETREWTYLAD